MDLLIWQRRPMYVHTTTTHWFQRFYFYIFIFSCWSVVVSKLSDDLWGKITSCLSNRKRQCEKQQKKNVWIYGHNVCAVCCVCDVRWWCDTMWKTNRSLYTPNMYAVLCILCYITCDSFEVCFQNSIVSEYVVMNPLRTGARPQTHMHTAQYV